MHLSVNADPGLESLNQNWMAIRDNNVKQDKRIVMEKRY